MLSEEAIPEGLQLVPIRQLISNWSKEQFLQASRAVQLLEWRRNPEVVATVDATEVPYRICYGVPFLSLTTNIRV